MYYRYEISYDGGSWYGICSELNATEQRKMNRFIKAPKWYKDNPNRFSTCWFTEYGYEKHHKKMEEIISEMDQYRSPQRMGSISIRLRKQETLKDVVFCGKVQCISRHP